MEGGGEIFPLLLRERDMVVRKVKGGRKVFSLALGYKNPYQAGAVSK
jgi:hypothetical protein